MYSGDSHYVNCTDAASSCFGRIKLDSFNHGGKTITVRPPVGSNIQTIYNAFRTNTPIVPIDSFKHAPDGVYTYLISDKGFLLNQVRSHLELGTMHRILAEDSKSTKVYVAGEVLKEGAIVVFNLMSGTYSHEILKRTGADKEAKSRIEASMISYVHRMFTYHGFPSVAFTEDVFINEMRLPVTNTELKTYQRMGYNVIEHNKETFGGSLVQVSKLQAILAREQAAYRKFPTERTKATIALLKAQLAHIEEGLSKSTAFVGKGGGRKNTKTRKQRVVTRRS